MRRHPGPPPPPRACHRGRQRTHGQALVEFALCAPIVFGILFAVVNGGLFMYAKNAVARASNVGAISESTLGTADSVDVDTLKAMSNAGVGANSLVGLKWVRIEEVTYSTTCACYQTVTNCPDPNGGGGLVACVNTYDKNGFPMWSEPGACTTMPNFCPPWPGKARSVHATGNPGLGIQPASLVRMTIHYTFSFVGSGTTFTLDEQNLFRLEPKDV